LHEHGLRLKYAYDKNGASSSLVPDFRRTGRNRCQTTFKVRQCHQTDDAAAAEKSPATRSAGPWRTARQESTMFPAKPLVEEMSGMNDVISTT